MASFHTCFAQLFPATETTEPEVLFVRAVSSEAARDKLRDLLKEVPNIVEIIQNEPFVVTTSMDDVKNPIKIECALNNTKATEQERVEEFGQRTERTERDKFNFEKEHIVSEKRTKVWNKLRWVRFMKKMSGIPEDEIYHEGTIIRNKQNDNDDDDLLLDAPKKMYPAPAPPSDLIKEQYVVVIIHPDSDDRKTPSSESLIVEPAMQVCGVYATEQDANDAVAELSGTCYCIAKTGGWLRVLQPVWSQWEIDVKYDNPTMDEMIRNRKASMEQTERAKSDVKRQQDESYGRACEYAQKLGMDVDELIEICKDPKGKQEALDLLYIQDKTCMEDAVDDLRERYLGIKPKEF